MYTLGGILHVHMSRQWPSYSPILRQLKEGRHIIMYIVFESQCNREVAALNCDTFQAHYSNWASTAFKLRTHTIRFKLHTIGSMNIISMYQWCTCIFVVMVINFKYLNVVVSGFLLNDHVHCCVTANVHTTSPGESGSCVQTHYRPPCFIESVQPSYLCLPW